MAGTDYFYPGQNNYLIDGQTSFNAAFDADDLELGSAGFTDTVFEPIYGDIDNDGDVEIIVMDANSLYILEWNGVSLIIEGVIPHVSPNSNAAGFSPPIIHDLNGGFDEIIFYQGSENITAITWNGSDHILTRLGTPTFPGSIKASQINCYSGTCLMVSNFVSGSQYRIKGHSFDITGILNETDFDLFTTDASIRSYCLPLVRSMPVMDVDKNGNIDYVVSAMGFRTTTSQEVLKVGLFSLSGSGDIFKTWEYSDEEPSSLNGDADAACTSTNMGYVSAPLIVDVDNSAWDGTNCNGNGCEIIVAFQDDLEVVFGLGAEEFRMIGINADGSHKRTYRQNVFGGLEVNGLLMSNPYETRTFTQGLPSFCVTGWDNINDEMNTVCGSESTADTGVTFGKEWTTDFSDISGVFNMTATRWTWRNMIHTIQATGSASSGEEVLTTFGIFTLDKNDNFQEQIYAFPTYDPNVVTMIDTGTGLNDILILEENVLYYLDDGYSRTGCGTSGCISGVEINPTPEQVWNNNTRVSVTVTLIDIDDDGVAAKVTLYDGDDNEFTSGWSANFSSGVTIPLVTDTTGNLLSANKTGTGFSLVIEARDTYDTSDVESLEYLFSVAPGGIEYGDAIFTESFEIEGVDVGFFVDDDADQSDNVAKLLIQELEEGIEEASGRQTGLGYSGWWLLLMLLVGGGAVFGGIKSHMIGSHLLIGVLFMEGILLILGTVLGFLNVGILITVIILLILAAAIAIIFRNPAGG